MNAPSTALASVGGAVAQVGGALAQSNAQRAIAEVQASMMIARAYPRDEVKAIDKIINAFTRPKLAEVSQYQYSKGGTEVSGPSIRSAEAIAQLWGNIQFGFRELNRGVDADGVGYSEVEAFAWDMESGTKRPAEFRVRHWRDTRSGGYPLKDEREIYELCANMAQRRVRACILAVIPGDVIEQAMAQADSTMAASVDVTPELIAQIVSVFEKFGVSKAQLEKRIQRRIETMTPGQVLQLKKIHVSLRDGMSVPGDWFAMEDAPDAGAGAGSAPASRTASVKEKAKAAAAAAKKDDAQSSNTGSEQTDGGASSGAPAMTFAEVASALEKAEDKDSFDAACDLIQHVADAGQRDELSAIVKRRLPEFGV